MCLKTCIDIPPLIRISIMDSGSMNPNCPNVLQSPWQYSTKQFRLYLENTRKERANRQVTRAVSCTPKPGRIKFHQHTWWWKWYSCYCCLSEHWEVTGAAWSVHMHWQNNSSFGKLGSSSSGFPKFCSSTRQVLIWPDVVLTSFLTASTVIDIGKICSSATTQNDKDIGSSG